MSYNSICPPDVRKCAIHHSDVVVKLLLLFCVSNIQKSVLTSIEAHTDISHNCFTCVIPNDINCCITVSVMIFLL